MQGLPRSTPEIRQGYDAGADNPQEAEPLSKGQFQDLWDHAVLLCQVGYDPISAMPLFTLLADQAPTSQTKAVLLLNFGLLHCQLGEYSQAEPIFQKILPLFPFTAPLAHFLLGIVRFELAEYQQACCSFKLCASVLQQTESFRDYRPFGLEFVLLLSQVIENEESAAYEYAHEYKPRKGHRLLNRIPASSIFGSAILNDDPFKVTPTVGSPRLDIQRQACSSDGTYIPPQIVVRSSDKPSHRASRNDSAKDVPTKASWAETPRPAPKTPRQRPMVPRAPCSEPSNLRILAHFFRSTGPDSLEKIDEQTVDKPDASEQSKHEQYVKTYVSDDTKRSSGRGRKLQRNKLLRDLSTRTLNRATSIRTMTRNVFSTPLTQLGAGPSSTPTESEKPSQGKEIHRPGPQQKPVLHIRPENGNMPGRKAVFDTATTDSERTEGKQGCDVDSQSIDSYRMFSLGRQLM